MGRRGRGALGLFYRSACHDRGPLLALSLCHSPRAGEPLGTDPGRRFGKRGNMGSGALGDGSKGPGLGRAVESWGGPEGPERWEGWKRSGRAGDPRGERALGREQGHVWRRRAQTREVLRGRGRRSSGREENGHDSAKGRSGRRRLWSGGGPKRPGDWGVPGRDRESRPGPGQDGDRGRKGQTPTHGRGVLGGRRIRVGRRGGPAWVPRTPVGDRPSTKGGEDPGPGKDRRSSREGRVRTRGRRFVGTGI